MSGSVGHKRAYRSPLREEQAARTRQRIVETAAALFDRQGFGGTTMTDIAREAGVSVESVHATGSKAALLLAAFRHALSGQTQWSSMFEIDSVKQVFEGVDADDALDRVVGFLVEGHARSARLVLEFRNVAATDPLVAAEWADHMAFRCQGYRVVADWLVGLGVVAAPASDREMAVLTATLSTIMSAETYVQLTSDWGHDADRYGAWIRRQLRAAGTGIDA